jgi:hypothetical protein
MNYIYFHIGLNKIKMHVWIERLNVLSDFIKKLQVKARLA